MIRLSRINPSRYQSFDAAQLGARFARLQSLLAGASPATRSVFAEPGLVQGSDSVDWFSRLGGQPQPLSQVPEAEAKAVRARLNDALNDVRRIADERAAVAPDDAEFLRAAASYPSDADVFVLNGQPVVTAWGHGLAGAQPIAPVPPAAAAVAAAAAIAPDAAQAAEEGGAAPPTGARWGRWLLVLLLLLLALALLAWWHYRDFKWPPWLDHAAFHQAAGISEQELIRLANGLESDIEALPKLCDPPPEAGLLQAEEAELRKRVSDLHVMVSDQRGRYEQHGIPYSPALRALQERVPPLNERITAALRECDRIAAELAKKRAEEIIRQQREEQERLRREKEAREAEDRRAEAERQRQDDEFDKRRAAAGGEEGELTVTLLWNTVDDLDLHIHCPNGDHIFYNARSGCGGKLDVDRNARDPVFGIPQGPVTREPIENVFWGSAQHGRYQIKVDLFKEGTTSRGARPFKIKVQKGDDVQYFDGTVSSRDKEASFSFSYP
jgi:hypothetical protein